MQLNLNIVKEKSRQLEIPLPNLLAGSILELCVRRIAQSVYGEVLWLENGDVLGAASYKKGYELTLYYSYMEDVHRNDPNKPKGRFDMDTQKAIKDVLCPQEEPEEIIWKSELQENRINLKATLGDMTVPVSLVICQRDRGEYYPQTRELRLLMENNKTITYLHFPYEWMLAHHFVSLMEKMELLPETEYYLEMYDIVAREPVNGRKVREYIEKLLETSAVKPEVSRLETVLSYDGLRYMKAKWKVVLRRKKRSGPTLTQALQLLGEFYMPLWKSLSDGEVFFGDWMPQLGRYL